MQTALRIPLFGDIHERASDWRIPLPPGPKRRNRIETIRRAGVLFVHIPKNAGTSISSLLYGHNMRHETIRYYRHIAPDLRLPSFAIWRDPIDRFLSAYAFARNGGGRSVRLNPHFAERYTRFQTIDDALDHIEQAPSPYALDYIFRPQSWFVCDDRNTLAIDHLFPMNALHALPRTIPALRGHTIPHLNDSIRSTIPLTDRQISRLKTLYPNDYALKNALTHA